jgi:recombinational DNA repair protein (RecF pathway)
MMVEVEGIVCGSRPVGETSLLVTILTDNRGKRVVRARGAMKDYRRTGAVLDTTARSQWILSARGFADDGIPIVYQADLIDPHVTFRRDLERLLRAFFLLEIVRLHYAEGGDLYNHLATGLAALDRGKAGDRSFLWWFALRTLVLSGHAPVLDRCVICSAGGGRCEPSLDDRASPAAASATSAAALSIVEFPALSLRAGGVVCSTCASRVSGGADYSGRSRPAPTLLPLSAPVLSTLQALSGTGGGVVDSRTSRRLSAREAVHVGVILRRLITWPVGGDVSLPALDTLQSCGEAWSHPRQGSE